MFKKLNYELDSFIKFSQKKGYLIFSLIFIAFLSYGFKIANYTLSIDEEINFEGGSLPHTWIADGRWGIAIFKKLFHTSAIIPYWSTFLSVFLLFVSAIFWCYLLNFFLEKKEINNYKKNIILFVFGAIYLSFPLNANYIILSFYNLELSFGILLVAISSWFGYQWLQDSKSKSHFIISYLCLVFAISIYESFTCYFLTAIFSFIVINFYVTKAKPINLKHQATLLFKIFFLTLTSTITFLIIAALLHLKYPSNGYVKGYIWFGRMPIHDILGQIKSFYLSVLYAGGSLFYYKLIILTLIISFVAFTFNLIVNKPNNKLFNAFYFFLLLSSPWLITLLFGGITPLRAFQSAAYLMGFLWVLILLSFDNKIINRLLIVISFFIILLQTQQISLLFQSNYLRYQRDLLTANSIANKIHHLGIANIDNYPVVFIGQLHSQPNKIIFQSELIGSTFYDWGKDTYMRTLSFMKDVGYPLQWASLEAQAKAEEDAKNMQDWPSEKSVALKHDVVIVKFSSTKQ